MSSLQVDEEEIYLEVEGYEIVKKEFNMVSLMEGEDKKIVVNLEEVEKYVINDELDEDFEKFVIGIDDEYVILMFLLLFKVGLIYNVKVDEI